jgi:hypothetical protein
MLKKTILSRSSPSTRLLKTFLPLNFHGRNTNSPKFSENPDKQRPLKLLPPPVPPPDPPLSLSIITLSKSLFKLNIYVKLQVIQNHKKLKLRQLS